MADWQTGPSCVAEVEEEIGEKELLIVEMVAKNGQVILLERKLLAKLLAVLYDLLLFLQSLLLPPESY